MEDNSRKRLYDKLSESYNLGTFEEFDSKMGNDSSRRALYDKVTEKYNIGTFEEFNAKMGNTHKQNLDAFNTEFGSFMNDFESRDSAETKMSRAGMSSGLVVPAEGSITGEERQRYNDLYKQEEALKKAWYNSPDYLESQGQTAVHLAQMRNEIDRGRLTFAQNNPVIEGYNPSATRGAEADVELQLFETASRIIDDTIKLHNAPSRYDGANAWQNVKKFAKGTGDTLSDVDFWTSGLTEIADNLGVRNVLQKVQKELGNLNNLDEATIEGILSPAEKAVLQAWALNAQEQLNRSGDLSRGYQAGQSATESLGFMAEFALTGGVGKAASEGVETMAKWLGRKVLGQMDDAAAATVREMGEKIAKSTVGKYGARLADALAETAGKTLVMPSTFRNISEKAAEIQEDAEGNRYLTRMNDAFAKGFTDSFIENLSEGGRVNAIGDLIGDVAGKIPAYKKIVDKFANSKAGELLTAFNSSGIMNTLRAGGWHGFGEEYLEEWYGNALRTITGLDKDALKDFATVDNQLITITSFLPMTIFGGTVSTAQVLSAKKGLDKKAEMLRSALLERGYDEKQADNMIDMMRGASPAEISQTLTPIVNTVALRDVNEAAALMKPVGEFAEAVRRWQAFDTKYQYQEQEQRDNLRNQMTDTLGQFWQEDENGRQIVQRGVNANGEVVYLLGKPSATEAQSGAPQQVAAITSEGRKVFVDPSAVQLEGELEMNDFLGNEVMAEKGNKEQARMIEEKERALAQVRQMSAPGTTINLGTTEAPMMGTVAQRTTDGVVVAMQDGSARQVSYEELGNYIGVNTTPLTDAQMDESEADALVADKTQREAELDQEYENLVSSEVEIEEAQVEVEQAVEAATPLPTKADGSVDQTALWNNDPVKWAQWNDEQRQDGGVNSLGYINAAITREESKVNKLTKAYDAEPDFDVRASMEPQIKEASERINRLVSLQQKYAPLMQAEAQQVAEGSEQAEPVVANKDRERSVESVVAALYDKGLDDAEVSANIDANIEEYEKKLAAQSKRAPKMGSDADAYLQKKQKYQEKMDEIQQELNFWTSARQAISKLRENEMQVPEAPGAVGMEKDPEPQNAVEFAARELGLKEGGIKLQRKSFAEHTGYGNEEMKKFFGLFKSKQDGGMTVEQAGERLMEIDRENNTGFFDQDDPNAGLDAILDALSANKTIGELRSYTARRRQEEAQQEADAAYSAMMADYEAAHGMSAEEVADYNAVMRSELIQKGLNETEYNELNSIFAEEISEYDTRTEETFGRSDGEVPSDVEGGSDAVPEGSSNVLQSQQSDYTSGEGTAPEGEQSSEDVGDLYAQDGTSQVQPAAVESSLDEDMPDFLGMSDEDVVRRATEELTTEQERANLEEEKRAALRDRIKKWEQKLGVQVDVMESVDDVTNAQANQQILNGREVFGWFEVASGKVAFYLPDYVSLPTANGLSEIDKTYIHEIVSHRGLRGLLGEEKYGELCDMVWDAMTEEQKTKFLNYPGVNGNTRAAADEFIAHFAENVDYNDNRTLWDKIVDFIKGLFNSVELPVHISNESLADLLRMSYSRLAKNAAAVDTDSNQQAEGNTMFRAEDGSLVGMHNISEEKLKKVIRQGGAANPSTAVIDIDRQIFGSYGEISFIMPSSLVDAGTGRNAGTFTADAWTPTYPQVSKRFSDDKLQRAYWRDISAIPEEMSHEVLMAFDSWLDNRNASGLAYMFLHERGEAPEMVRVEAKFPQEIKDKVSAILGEGRTGLYGLSAEEKQAMLELYIQENFGGNREEFDKSIADRIQRIEDRLSTGKVPSFVEKRITLDLQWMKEHAYDYDELSKFVSAITADIRHAGEVNDAATTNRALDYIKDNGLEKEFDRWKESLNDRYGIKEYLFDGYTPSGNQRWLPNTVENASRLMNKQGLAGATGMAASFNRFVATLAPKKKTLSDIRASKDRLVEDEKLVDDFREKWSEVFFDLGVKCQPDAKGYEDYGLARLTEAAQKKNPGAYLKKEYGVELSQEDLQKLSEMIKAIKTEFPARYFETKFQRPVYLNEFAAAVIPTNTSEDIKQAVSEAGLPIFEYNPTVEGSRKEATMKATEGEGIRFRTRITPENEDIRFRMSNENQAIFVSNAARAVEGIKQEKATPEQWLKMLEKAGGLKAGEDKWMGLSDWLKASDKKTLTKQEVLDFINENMIVIEEAHYTADAEDDAASRHDLLEQTVNARYKEILNGLKDIEDYDERRFKAFDLFQEELGEFADLVELDWSGAYLTFSYEDLADYIEFADMFDVNIKLDNPIHDTRLAYTTDGLENRHEIALTVPTIESWGKEDTLHFGDAGEGRAVAWIRFGETEVPTGEYKVLLDEMNRLKEVARELYEEFGGRSSELAEVEERQDELRADLRSYKNSGLKVLVIDEIQSKRHQEGREKGYKRNSNSPAAREIKRYFISARDAYNAYQDQMAEKYGNDFKNASSEADFREILTSEEFTYLLNLRNEWEAASLAYSPYKGGIPDAPFDKNWHELAMKRMLRYAAENGYDAIAWTKGDQQAERYNIGSYVSSIEAQEEYDGNRDFGFYMGDSDEALTVTVDENGTVVSAEDHLSQAVGRPLADLVGKDMAVKMMQMEEYDVLEDTDLKVGNEGMKGFYDKMLPAFMNKYGKKWGIKVEDIDLPNLGKSGYTMHSVPVTEEMKASVMEGQVMFRMRGSNESAGEFMQDVVNNEVYANSALGRVQVANIDEATAKRFGYTLEKLKKVAGNYSFKEDLITIFAHENVDDSDVVLNVLYHEAIHRAVAKFVPDAVKVGELLWNNADIDEELASIKADILKNGYKEDEWHEEMLCEALSDAISAKVAQDIPAVLPNGLGDYVKQILDKIGYGKERKRGRIGWTNPQREEAGRSSSSESDRGIKKEDLHESRSEVRFRAVEITPEVQDEMDAIHASALVMGNYMKAPNGADTNLTAEQWAMVRTKNFKKWFGDWENDPENASKVVDENGEPKVVYHGGAWRPLLEERGNAVFKLRGGLMGKGAYFTDKLSTAIEYARDKYGWEHDEEVSDEFLDDNGYVTEVFLNIRNEDNIREYYGETYYLATNHGQIKSAIANTGEFSLNFDIRFRVNENPTEAQKEAGNYKMGHLNLDGYRITIENPKGSVRRGTDSKGNAWENTLNNDYGYIRGTEGVDGDHIDVYLSDNPSEGNVFVVDQVNPQTREFDEHKVMYGFNSAEEAREAYLANFSEGWDGLGTITEVTKDEFKKWIQSSHRKTKPFSEYKSVKAIGAQSEGEEIEDYLLPSSGTPTDEVVANGLDLTPAQTAELAGNIFAALPEDSRKKITEGLSSIFDIQDAILQIPTSLAMKEKWNDEDRQMAEIVASEVTKMAREMTRPFSASEGLWVLYNALNPISEYDIVSQASRALVQRNLGFDAATLEVENEAKEDVRFRTVGNASANAKASLYNRGAANVWTRLKESFVDMNASVEELVNAIEKASGKKAEGFENVLLALNQQSSKGLAAMKAYVQKFLNKMLDEIRAIMNKTDFKYEDIVRYVILKHGLERNEKMAQRDAKAHYQKIYDDIIAKIKGMNPAQKRTYLTNAQLKDSDAKAELTRLQGVNTSALTPDQLRDHKKELAKAKKEASEAAEHLVRAQKIATMTEQDAQNELDKIFKKIEKGTDSVYKEMRKNDYSGISSMFYDTLGVDRKNYATEEEYQSALMQAKADKYDNLGDIEGAAQTEVTLFENAVDTKDLWKSINNATKETLRQQYEANMISKDQYLNLRDMFEYYVPLRGFADNTAEDMYTYYRRPNSTGYTKPILGAEGRKTEAESPFGWIAAMAGSAIASNVKNEAKLALYYFVANRPENGIATLSRTWFVHTPGDVDANGKKIFRPAYPPFNEDLSTDAAKQAYEDWQEQMKDLQKQGLAYESGQKLNLGDTVVNISDKNKPEHIVNVKIGGKDYTIIINGNPRAAQAINGDLNIETDDTYNNVLLGPWLRWLSSVNTSYNPEFWATNMMRDMAFTWMAVNIKEDPAYRRRFSENYRKAFQVISLAAKNEKGTLGNSYIEQMYQEFVQYGGVTGYTQIKDNETWEKEIENYLKKTDASTSKAIKAVKDGLHAMHRFGESLEQVSRFAAFLTSREMGKSTPEAINDAKEITVNFNRKGSGKRISFKEAKKLTKKNGQKLNDVEATLVSGITFLAPIARSTIMFFNASVQALNAWFKLWKANKLRSLGWVIGYAAIGVMNALIHALLDDDDDYLDMPQYERRSSLMLGGNGVYFKWALPQEMSAFYALGELTVETILGRNPHQSAAAEAAKVVGELLPINVAKAFLDKGGWVDAMPSQIKPALELLRNEDYKGDVIFNEQKWLSEGERERTANWESAYKGTGRIYIGISKLLNNLTDSKDLDEAGWINIHPESLEHVVESMTGGVGRTVSKLFNFITAAINPEEDVTVKQTPFLNRFLTINDERYRNVHVNDVFDYYEAEAEHAATLEKKYKKDRNSEALKNLRMSDEYKLIKIYSKYKKPLEKIQEKIKVADGTAERKDLMKQQDELKRRMIKEISELP